MLEDSYGGLLLMVFYVGMGYMNVVVRILPSRSVP